MEATQVITRKIEIGLVLGLLLHDRKGLNFFLYFLTFVYSFPYIFL